MEVIFFVGLGLIIGSFLNVVILREGTGKDLGGRSACMSCGHTLRSIDLVPFFSWLFLRGRCRYCGSGVSFQYPAVELATGLLFGLVALTPLTTLESVLACTILAFYVAIFVYDLRHTIIPDLWSYGAAACALFYSFLHFTGESSALAILLAGPLAALPLFLLWAVSRGRWMGLGDPKLALSIGWVVGFQYAPHTILLSFVIGALVSVCILLPMPHLLSYAQRAGFLRLRGGGEGFTMGSEVPFGPFLIVGTLIVWFFLLFELPLPFLI